MVSVTTTDSSLFQKANKLLSGTVKNDVFKAASSAMNRAATTARSKGGTLATAEYTISKNVFNKYTTFKTKVSGGYSSGGLTTVSVTFAGKQVPLLEFSTRLGRNGLVTTQVKKNSTRATLQHAFIKPMNGHINAYERRGSPRYPVHGIYALSTAQMMANDEVKEKMETTLQEEFEKRFEHEIERRMNGWGL